MRQKKRSADESFCQEWPSGHSATQTAVAQSARAVSQVGGSSPSGSLDLKIRRDADMLMVKIMIYLAVVAAALIVVCTMAGGNRP